MRYSNTRDTWEYAVPPFQGNETTGYISGGLSATPGGESWAKDCSLSIGSNNTLYLAWAEESYIDGPGDIQVFRSVGEQSWERMGPALSAYDARTQASLPNIKTSPTDKTFTSWQEFSWDNDGNRQSFISAWEHNTWNSLSNANGINAGQKSSIRSTVSIDQSERPIIAWFEGRGAGDYLSGEYLYIRRYNQ